MSLISKFKHIQFEWIPRGQNKEADKLTCIAYEDAVTGESIMSVRRQREGELIARKGSIKRLDNKIM